MAPPTSGFWAQEDRPLWQLTRASGTVVFVSSDAAVLSNARLEAVR
jgi:hypothetical protein